MGTLDLTKVKAITKWPDTQLWRDGMLAWDWLEIETGAFDILGGTAAKELMDNLEGCVEDLLGEWV